MLGTLGIICPQVGTPSETFICRHVLDLCPGRTVVVTGKILDCAERAWSTNCPTYSRMSAPLIKRGFHNAGLALRMDSLQQLGLTSVVDFLREHRVDVVLGEFLDVSWAFRQILQKLGVRFYAHAHGCDLSILFRYPKWRRRYASFAEADGVIVVNQVMKDRLLSIGVPDEKIHYIPYGVDVPKAPLERVPSNGLVRCIAVGRMVPKKAPLKLLKAFQLATFKNDRLHLDYVGDGPLMNQVTGFIDEHALQDRVTLHREQNHAYVLDLMKRGDMFVQHSMVDPATGDEEGLPLAILEAMAMALPVVSTRHAGIPDAVVEEDSGLLVDEGDCTLMSQHLLALADDAVLRLSMGRAGWQRAEKHFSWEREKAALIALMGLNSTGH